MPIKYNPLWLLSSCPTERYEQFPANKRKNIQYCHPIEFSTDVLKMQFNKSFYHLFEKGEGEKEEKCMERPRHT